MEAVTDFAEGLGVLAFAVFLYAVFLAGGDDGARIAVASVSGGVAIVCGGALVVANRRKARGQR